MVILGYFYREAHEAASIDAAWRSATEALGGQPCTSKSIGTAAIKPLKAAQPSPTPTLSRPAAQSYLSTLTRQATNLASTVTTGFNAFPDISFGATSDGSLFEFTDAQRQKAKVLLNEAASAEASASSSNASIAQIQNQVVSPSERSDGSGRSTARSSPELLARGRSSSVWSSAASVTSVTQRSRVARGDVVW